MGGSLSMGGGILLNPEKIAFLVDSCAELEPRHRKGLPVYVVPLRIACVDKDYNDGEDIFAKDIYKRLERGELPKTSLPEPATVEKALDKIKADGYKKVIALPLSSGLSGTYNMVKLLCDERKDLETFVFDTRSGAMGIAMVVHQLWKELQAGATWEKLTGGRVEFLFKNTFPYFSVDTLEYLQKGGRIGKITALAGTMLSIKPLLGFAEDGQLVNVAKVRGHKQVPGKLIELVKAHVDDPKRPFNLAVENGGDPDGMKALAKALKAAIPGCKDFYSTNMDATLATYVGRGMLGAAIQFLA